MARIVANKNYGDQKAIDALVRQSSGLKQAASDTVPTLRRPEGRPRGATTAAPQATPSPAPNIGPPQTQTLIPPEHEELMANAARKIALAQMSADFERNPVYGPWLREYALRMRTEAEDAARQVKDLTPDFPVD